MYNVDVTKPFPYRDNPRSLTLLAYLNDVGDGGGGETEFMLAKPRPVRVKAAEGAALIWGNCELEDVAPTVLWALGLEVPELAGSVIRGAYEDGWMAANEPRFREGPMTPPPSLDEVSEDEEEVLERLRELGYVR